MAADRARLFFLQGLASQFKPEEICLISQDNYYKPIEQQTIDENGVENFDLPSSIDRETFHADILKMKLLKVAGKVDSWMVFLKK